MLCKLTFDVTLYSTRLSHKIKTDSSSACFVPDVKGREEELPSTRDDRVREHEAEKEREKEGEKKRGRKGERKTEMKRNRSRAIYL